MKKLFAIICLLAIAAAGLPIKSQYQLLAAKSAADTHFTITFLTGTFPENIVLGSSYAGPANPSLAEYDPGTGVWSTYTTNAITRAGDYIKFRGDWRNAAGTYAYMFDGTLNSVAYTCKFSGSFKEYPTHASAYAYMFYNATALVSIDDNPIPVLTGAPAASMFLSTLYSASSLTTLPAGTFDTSGLTGAPAVNMFLATLRGASSLTTLPAGTFDTSGLTGAPAAYMFYYTLFSASSLTTLPAGTFDTSGLTGAPAAYMFYSTLYGASSLESLPAGTFDTSGLTGAPAVNMFHSALRDASSLTNFNITIGAGITLTDSNVVGTLTQMFDGCTDWTGYVYWGTNVLTDVITPDSDINTFRGCTSKPNYDTMDANWK